MSARNPLLQFDQVIPSLSVFSALLMSSMSSALCTVESGTSSLAISGGTVAVAPRALINIVDFAPSTDNSGFVGGSKVLVILADALPPDVLQGTAQVKLKVRPAKLCVFSPSSPAQGVTIISIALQLKLIPI
jgi:hypothetical protein